MTQRTCLYCHAQLTGTNRYYCNHRCRGRHLNEVGGQPKKTDPTPEEIEAATAELRTSWRDEDYYKRGGLRLPEADVTRGRFAFEECDFVE